MHIYIAKPLLEVMILVAKDINLYVLISYKINNFFCNGMVIIGPDTDSLFTLN